MDAHEAIATAADRAQRGIDAVAADIADTLHREISDLPSDPGSVRGTHRAAMRSTLVVIEALRAASAGTTVDPVSGLDQLIPEVVRTARFLARSGQGIRLLIRAIQLTHGRFLGIWDAELASLDLRPEVMREAARLSHAISFTWVDAVTQQLIDEYERERDRLERNGEARRLETISALLAGDPGNPAAVGRTLGYELLCHHTAMIVWSADDGAAARLEPLEPVTAEIADSLGSRDRPLTMWTTATVLRAWVATERAPSASALDALAGSPRADGVSVALGEPAYGPAGFRNSLRDAEDTFHIALLAAHRPGTITTYANVRLAALFAGDLPRVRRFVSRHLGALATDDDHHARLRATLNVFLDEHRSRQAAAKRLGVHANTIGNRVRACEDILGDQLANHRRDVHVALTLAQRLGSAVLNVPADARV